MIIPHTLSQVAACETSWTISLIGTFCNGVLDPCQPNSDNGQRVDGAIDPSQTSDDIATNARYRTD